MQIKGFNKLTLLDYPGQLAAIIFTGGCNLACPFCHNSSLIPISNEELLSENEILNYLAKYHGKLDAVVISGGEPTIHKDLPIFLKKIKKMGYLIKLDTNGTNPSFLNQLIKDHLIDYIAMDLKNSPLKYPLTTNKKINLSKINESIQIIKNSGLNHEFRTTLVKEYHQLEDIITLAKLTVGSPYFLQPFQNSATVLKKNLHTPTQNQLTLYLKEAQKINTTTYLRGTIE